MYTTCYKTNKNCHSRNYTSHFTILFRRSRSFHHHHAKNHHTLSYLLLLYSLLHSMYSILYCTMWCTVCVFVLHFTTQVLYSVYTLYSGTVPLPAAAGSTGIQRVRRQLYSAVYCTVCTTEYYDSTDRVLCTTVYHVVHRVLYTYCSCIHRVLCTVLYIIQ